MAGFSTHKAGDVVFQLPATDQELFVSATALEHASAHFKTLLGPDLVARHGRPQLGPAAGARCARQAPQQGRDWGEAVLSWREDAESGNGSTGGCRILRMGVYWLCRFVRGWASKSSVHFYSFFWSSSLRMASGVSFATKVLLSVHS